MYTYTTNCIKKCIPEKHQIPNKMWPQIITVLQDVGYMKNSIGRPSIDVLRAIAGIYYVLRTGVQWNALPRCFGSDSAVHRTLKELEKSNFFKALWEHELKQYIIKNPGTLNIQAGDCAHIPAPLGGGATGKSPVNRSKIGTKRSVITDKNGVVIGRALTGGNTHDSQIFIETLRSIPSFIRKICDWAEMNLDAAYGGKKTETALFNYRYMPRINKKELYEEPNTPHAVGGSRYMNI